MMKLSGGITGIVATVLAFIFSALACALLYMGLHRDLPVGPSYATWVGIGVAGIAAIDIIAFGQTFTSWGYLCLFLILCGVVGLNLTSGPRKDARRGRL